MTPNFFNLDPASRARFIQIMARIDPATAARLAAVKSESEQTRSQLNVLKRLVRRRVARLRHFSPSGRLVSPLSQVRMRAVRRAHMSPASVSATKFRSRRFAANVAYMKYQTSAVGNRNRLWNIFTRVHAKSGRVPRNITRNVAHKMYRNV